MIILQPMNRPPYHNRNGDHFKNTLQRDQYINVSSPVRITMKLYLRSLAVGKVSQPDIVAGICE